MRHPVRIGGNVHYKFSLASLRAALSDTDRITRINQALGADGHEAFKSLRGRSRIVTITAEQDTALRSVLVEVLPAEILDRLQIEVSDYDSTVLREDDSGKAYSWSTLPGVERRTLSLKMLTFEPYNGEVFYSSLADKGVFVERSIVSVELISVNICCAF